MYQASVVHWYISCSYPIRYMNYLKSSFIHEQLNISQSYILVWLGFVARFAGKTDVVKMHVGLPPDITFPLRWLSIGTNKDETIDIKDANMVRKTTFNTHHFK